jgi:HlyD family secretion protein
VAEGQLRSDLASLRIQRDVDPDRRSLLGTVLRVLIGLGAVSALLAFAVPRAQSALFKAEVATTEIAMVSPAQASINVTSTGYVVPQVISRVGAKLPGRIARVLVKEGDVVKAGDLLVERESSDQRSLIAAAEAKVVAARARAAASRATIAEIELQADRQRALVEREVAGRATAEDLAARIQALEAAARAADAEVKAFAADVESLRVTLADRRIVAPIAGTIVTKPPEIGEVVGLQLPRLEIADFDSLLVETDVPEARLQLIQPGKPCEAVLDAYSSKRYRCTTHEIGKRVNRAKATVPIKVKLLGDAQGVRPDMSARVSFLSEALTEEAMKEPPKRVVPESAITERVGAKVMFVVNGGQVKMVPISRKARSRR